MKWLASRVFWGSLLIIGGILFLIQNIFGYQFGSLFWSIAFGLGGLFFISLFISNRENWWGLIPGMTLIGIGLNIGLGALFPQLERYIGGTIILGAIGLSFLIIYILNREYWWAIIPTGVLLSLAIVVGLESFISDMAFVSLFFIGMGLTFAVVALIPTSEGKLKWAWLPAGVLLFMGLIFSAFSGAVMVYVWPVVLIVGGLYLLYRTFSSR